TTLPGQRRRTLGNGNPSRGCTTDLAQLAGRGASGTGRGERRMVNLELSWQEAAVAAACLAAAAVCGRLTHRRRLVAAAAFTGETALVLSLFALWQLAGRFAVA